MVLVHVMLLQVRDLLSPHIQKGGLKVRQHQSRGFYGIMIQCAWKLSFTSLVAVEGLMSVAVKDYKDIEGRMNEGTKNRTVASTNMNATSRFVSCASHDHCV